MAKILIVDDRKINRQFLSMLLDAVGHEVMEAVDGEQGLNVARRELPDLIISDLVMPKMDGFELVRQLRNDEAISRTQVIFYTASHLQGKGDAKKLAEQCGISHILTKPSEPQEILRVVELALAETAPALPPPSVAFSYEHLRVVTDELSHKVDELERVNRDLTALHSDLEKRVEERTFELSKLTLKLSEQIYERRRAETEREGFFNVSLDMLAIAGFDGYFKSLNPAWETTLGFGLDEMLTKSFYDFIHPNDIEKTKAELAHLAEGQTTFKFENRYLCKDSSYKWLLWSATPVVESGVTYAAARDITERKLAEAEKEKMNESLRQQAVQLASTNKELESFSYSVSHDLRAPLRSIDGFSQALIEDYSDKLDDDGQHYLRRVRAASQRMGQLIDDLLNLSRASRREMVRETVNLSNVARKAASSLRRSNSERDVKFEIQDGLISEGDARLLQVVLENLLGNAWKFTSKKIDARIEFGLAGENGQAAYFVRDNGAGFDMSYASKLFGAFQRLHDAEEFEGTGIGLATVQRIVNRHGGRVWAEGSVGAGATFYFTL